MRKGSLKRRILITGAIGLLMSLLFLLSKGTFSQTDAAQRYRDLSDACFITGAIMLGVAGLQFVAGNGIFDMINFGVLKVLSLVRSDSYRAEQPRTYYDYLQSKAGRNKGGLAGLLIIGGLFVALALLFVLLHDIQ